ncbi:MAG: STAS domain-containing protein [Spirochaetaceae bacterium]|jgi:SulP family sulfate permease|nr:STAS domain-containing protein [Spirochaetaceae bacterium]
MEAFRLIHPRDFIPRIVELFPGGKGRNYSLAALGRDCLAGLMVGIVALPLSMAFSIAAGGTPAQGLYTAMTAGFCVSLLGGSRFQIAGPTGAFVIIIFGVVAEHGMAGLIAATLLAGLILVIMGITGLGQFIKYIPYPVTTGFTTGIGALIFSQQIKDFFGLRIASSSPAFFEKWAEYVTWFHTLDPAALGVGLGTMAVIIILRRAFPRLPGAALGVAAATVICSVFALPVETIGSRFGGIPSAFPRPALPELSWPLFRAILPDSFTIALLAAIESLLSAVVADGMTGDRHNANMELAAQGLGNIASAVFGGIPATGAIARTAANIKSGAVSPVAGLVHALTLAAFVLFLSPAASAVPLSSLSAVLMVVSWDMSNVPRFLRLIRRSPRSDTIVLLTTFALTVAFDLTFAVEVGVILAMLLFLRRMIEVADIRPGNDDIMAKLAFDGAGKGEKKGSEGKKDAGSLAALARKDIEIYEIAGPFFFGVADMLQTILRRVSKPPRALILRMRDVPVIDSTGIAALESFMAQCRSRKIRLILCEIRAQPGKALEKSGFLADLGPGSAAPTLEDAIAEAERSEE